MKQELKKIHLEYMSRLHEWAGQKVLNIFIVNIIIAILLLLRSAGYFLPYFALTINIIVFLVITLIIFLLNGSSKTLFFLAVVFLAVTTILKLMGIEIWAERTAIYFYEAFIMGVIMVAIEDVTFKLRNETKTS